MRKYYIILIQGLDGGTTVSGTMIAAEALGIDVFVTGGIGGVHRDVETSQFLLSLWCGLYYKSVINV